MNIDIIDEVLGTVADQDEENVRLLKGYGRKTWGIDWRHGRLYKTSPAETPFDRAVKYLVTPRGQVEVYPDYADDLEFDNGYGSLIWTLIGEQLATADEATSALQAICDDAVAKLDDIESIVPEDVELGDATLSARIIITDNYGEVSTRELQFAR